MKFLVPSYNRVDRCRTVNYLHKVGVEKELIFVATQNESDYEAYTAAYGGIATVIYREAHNCAGNRNTLVDVMEDGEIALFLDDDLYSVSAFEFSGKYGKYVELDADGFRRFVDESVAFMEEHGADLYGVAMNTNSVLAYRNVTTAPVKPTQMISGAVMFARKTPLLRFDETLPCLDDAEICLKHIEAGRKTFRDFRYAMNKPQDTKERGGCHEVYANGGRERVIRELEGRYYPMAKHSKDWTRIDLRSGLR